MNSSSEDVGIEQNVRILAGGATLEGHLSLPERARGVVLFAHGSGSSRHSPRNRFVADRLHHAGLGTLLMDLLTSREEILEADTAHLRFDIGLLSGRLASATDWLHKQVRTSNLSIGYFGASTGAAAALVAAVQKPDVVHAVVSRGGRPDLAGASLPHVKPPTLLIVGSLDVPVLALNEHAFAQLGAEQRKLIVIPHASHLFEEPGTLDEVARLAAEWFTTWL